jgi:NADP-dependent 3-hydroxy acid dehydrogenase YdfG
VGYRGELFRNFNYSTVSTKHILIMTVIAVAGGTGGVGKTIVEKLLDSKFDIVVLSRVRSTDTFHSGKY